MQKDKNKWPPNHLSWERWAHSLMKRTISRLGAPCTSMAIIIKWFPSWSPLYLLILTMVLNFTIIHANQLITFETIVSRIKSITTASAIKTWSSQVMYRLDHNESSYIRAYPCSFHITCPFFWTKTYMTSQMTSCVAICWPPNKQRIKCVPNTSNPCPHSHVKKLNAEGWIKLRQKHNVEVKIKCAMWNE